MCLVLKDGESIRVASRDILVKKWVMPIKNSKSWVPVFREEAGELEFNKVLRAKYLDSEMRQVDLEELKVEGDKLHIESGFHSYHLSVNNRYCVFEKWGTKHYAVIPRGSEYAKGRDGDIVSTRIIVFSNLWRYLTWKLRKMMRN